MKLYPLNLLMATFVIFVIALFSTLSANAEPEISSIYIQVMDDKDLTPIPNATVYIDNEYVGETSPAGDMLLFTSVGSHTIKVHKEGYEDKSINVEVPSYDISVSIKLTEIKSEVFTDSYLYALSILFILSFILLAIAIVYHYRKLKQHGGGL